MWHVKASSKWHLLFFKDSLLWQKLLRSSFHHWPGSVLTVMARRGTGREKSAAPYRCVPGPLDWKDITIHHGSHLLRKFWLFPNRTYQKLLISTCWIVFSFCSQHLFFTSYKNYNSCLKSNRQMRHKAICLL